MKETVNVNGLTLCHKHSDGFTRSTLPDVCKSPTAPVPYTNVAFARDLVDGTVTVFSHNGAMNGIKGSRFAVSTGDNPGVGLGVKSGAVMSEATWLSWSPNVFMEGQPVTRLTDKMLMNKGNTISAGGYYTGKPNDPTNLPLMEQICKAACECYKTNPPGSGGSPRHTDCVTKEVSAWAKAEGKEVVPEVAWDNNGGAWSIRRDLDTDEILHGGGKRPGDFYDFDNKTLCEYKGIGDYYRKNQSENLDEICGQHDLTREEVIFKRDCNCGDEEKEPEKVPVTVPAPEKQEQPGGLFNWIANHPLATVAIVGLTVAGAALAVSTFGAGAPVEAPIGTAILSLAAAS
jgi:hypothetical protein